MELKVLNSDFKIISALDAYKSAIWTERYNVPGDFEITGDPVTLLARGVARGNYIFNPDSKYTMIIEDIKIETDAEDGALMTVTGNSLEQLLARRIVWNQTRLVGDVVSQIKYLIDNNCISPTKSERRMTKLVWSEPELHYSYTEEYDNQFIGESVLEAIEALCETNELGFMLYLSEEFKKNVFGTLSTSSTMTTAQVLLPTRAGELLIPEGVTTAVSFTFYSENRTVIKTASGSLNARVTVPPKAYYFSISFKSTDLNTIKIRATYPHMEFKIYDGLDRSWAQSIVPSVQFTPAFDNFKSSEYAEVSSDMANVALVGGDGEGASKKFTEYIDSSTEPKDLDRFETYVDDNTSQETDLLSVDEDPDRNIPYKHLGKIYTTGSTWTQGSTDYDLWTAIPVEPNSEYTISVSEAQSVNLFDKLNPIEIGGAGGSYGDQGRSANLGDLIWYDQTVAGNNVFCSNGLMSVIYPPATSADLAEAILDGYTVDTYYAVTRKTGVDKSFCVVWSTEAGGTAGKLIFRDDSYSTAAEFKAAMANKIIWYRNITQSEFLGKSYKIYQGSYAQANHRAIILPVEPNTAYTVSTGNTSTWKALAYFEDRPAPGMKTDVWASTSSKLAVKTSSPSTDWLYIVFYNAADQSAGRTWIKSINSLVVVKGGTTEVPSTYQSYGPKKLQCHWSAAMSSDYPVSGQTVSSNKSIDNLYPYSNEEQDDPSRHSDDWLYDPVDTEERPSSVTLKSGATEKYLCLGVCKTSEKVSGSIDLKKLIPLFEVNGKMRNDNYIAILEAKGKEELEKKCLNTTFEGEVEPSVNYVYGRDYFMGDIVTIQNEYGFEGRQRMTEFIRSHDESGETLVPSFTTKKEDNQ